MSLFRVFSTIHQLVVFEVQSRVSVSYGIVKRFFGYSSENESGNFTQMDDSVNSSHVFMIVGLGNFPHPDTRHSVGMRALDEFADKLGLTWESVQGRKGGLMCKTEIDFSPTSEDKNGVGITQIFLFKPKSLMNICGGNVARTAKSLGVQSDSIYLVHDELDLALGKVSIKNGGSARGHRGVLSCISDLKSQGLWPDESATDGFILPRLRVGIGRPTSKSQVIPYVLSPIPGNEVKVASSAMGRGMDLLMHHITNRVKRRVEHSREQTDEVT